MSTRLPVCKFTLDDEQTAYPRAALWQRARYATLTLRLFISTRRVFIPPRRHRESLSRIFVFIFPRGELFARALSATRGKLPLNSFAFRLSVFLFISLFILFTLFLSLSISLSLSFCHHNTAIRSVSLSLSLSLFFRTVFCSHYVLCARSTSLLFV